MFGMGGTEILVILVIAMIFLGPEKLPEAAAKISKGIRDIRKQQRELTQTIENDTEIGGAIRDLKSALRGDEIKRPPVRKPPPAAELPLPDAPGALDAAVPPIAEGTQVVAPALETPALEAPAPVASAPVAEADAAPAEADPAAAAPAEDDPNDPLKLIRPATGTAKREHG
ncbi:MAG TPA: twin-arginine translocase TatA/TatE family subunit [Kofleriaceae bacterium]|nr:twin-arginine translocase TatA/TatE family subunit [Kofleriaceae bacterium]